MSTIRHHRILYQIPNPGKSLSIQPIDLRNNEQQVMV